jgi:DNA-binding transcriptional ArsR family regulator
MTNTTAVNKSEAEKLKRNEQKWTKPLMDAGWNALPSIIIEKQAALGLDAIDMNIIVHLSNYWWNAEKLPHPSIETIATAIGLKPRAVQKRIKALEELKLLTRIERRKTRFGSDTNLYGFDGLIKAATPFALEKVKAREEKAQQERERVLRKKPKLSVVS